MRPITKIYHINALIEKVWQALTTIDGINAWGGGPAKMDLKNGGKFSLWAGDIFGKNLEIDAPRKLEQDWQYEGWKKSSRVVFELSEKAGETTLKLTQTGVPAEEHDNIDDGWDQYYLGPLKQYVENE